MIFFLMSVEVERFEIISLMGCLFFVWGEEGGFLLWKKFDPEVLSCPKLLRMMERMDGWMDGRGDGV